MATKKLEELEVYQIAMEIGEMVWSIVDKWDYFQKKTLGGQFVASADSIALNIAEGYGRYFYKENRNFCYYSRGSAKETVSASVKCRNRKLISEEEFEMLSNKLSSYFRLSFNYISSIGQNGPQ
jgi:four helix bundle protein